MPSDHHDDRWYRELDAANLAGYTVLVYETWQGTSRGDPATQIEEWMSMFKEDDMPDEVSTAQDVLNGSAPYVADSRYSYRDYFDGLKGAELNHKLRVIKEIDHDAERHQKESDSMLPDREGHVRGWRHTAAGADGDVHYEDFLAAIDRVAVNDDDEEAWVIIETWRSRSLRQEERSL